MLRSRKLPEDFDTSQVLRSPFDGKASPEAGGLPSPSMNGPKMLLADGFPRREDEYVVSPLNSAPAYISPAASDRNADHYSQPVTGMNRPPLSAPVSTFPRNGPDSFSLPGPPRMAEPYSQYGQAMRQHERYPSNSESLGPPGMPPIQHGGVEYGMSRPSSGMMSGYESRQLETPISQPGGASVPYAMHGSNPPGYQHPMSIQTKPVSGLEMSSPMHPQNRHLSTLNPVPAADAQSYRPMSYPPYAMNPTMPFAQQPASSMSMRPPDAGNAPTGSVYGPPDERISHPPLMDPSRGHPSFDSYPSII